MTFRRRDPTPIEIPPGIITAIVPNPRAPGRFDLAIDGVSVARLSIDGIERLNLHIGAQIDEAYAALIAKEAEISRTYDRAMSMLAVRGRASAELRRLLTQKGEPPTAIAEAIARLEAAGLLDDVAFARQFARSRAVNGGLSRRRIERELTRRGIDRSIAATTIAQTFVDEGVDELAAIERVADKKFRTLSRVDPPTQRRRLYGFLARRGYEADMIRQVVGRLTRGPVAE